eukprot:703315-Lingulodinium_polyedra.AAC.1
MPGSASAPKQHPTRKPGRWLPAPGSSSSWSGRPLHRFCPLASKLCPHPSRSSSGMPSQALARPRLWRMASSMSVRLPQVPPTRSWGPGGSGRSCAGAMSWRHSTGFPQCRPLL